MERGVCAYFRCRNTDSEGIGLAGGPTKHSNCFRLAL